MAWQSMKLSGRGGLPKGLEEQDLAPLVKLLDEDLKLRGKTAEVSHRGQSGEADVSGFLPDLFVKAKPNIKMQQKKGGQLKGGQVFASFEQLSMATAKWNRLAATVTPARRPMPRGEFSRTTIREETIGEKSKKISLSLNSKDQLRKLNSGAKIVQASDHLGIVPSNAMSVQTSAEGLGVNSPTSRSPIRQGNSDAPQSPLASAKAGLARSSSLSIIVPDSPRNKPESPKYKAESPSSRYKAGSTNLRSPISRRPPNLDGSPRVGVEGLIDDLEEEDQSDGGSDQETRPGKQVSLLQEEAGTGKHTQHDLVASSVALSRLPSYKALAKAPAERTQSDLESMKEILECCEPMEGLSEDALMRVCRMVELCTYKHKETIITEGDKADHYYLLLSGHVQVVTDGGHVGSVTIRKMGPGHGFGELAILNKTRRTAHVKVQNQTGVVCAKLKAALYDEVLREHHSKDNRYHDVYCF